MIEVLSTSSFCSTPDALEFDESEKGIFGSLRNIAQLPPGSPKEGDRVADSAAGMAGNQALGEAGEESPAAGTGECLGCDQLVSSSGFSLMSLYFQRSRAGTGLGVLRLMQMLI